MAVKLIDVVAIIEGLSLEAQKSLQTYLYEYVYHKKEHFSFIYTADVEELAASGLLCAVDDIRAKLAVYSRNQINDLIVPVVTVKYKKNMKLDDLIDWCLENLSGELPDLLSDVVAFEACAELDKFKRKIYTYLLRRNSTDTQIDGDGNCLEIPHGAEFSVSVDLMKGVSALSLSFPDDEITHLLDHFGVNPCTNFGGENVRK